MQKNSWKYNLHHNGHRPSSNNQEAAKYKTLYIWHEDTKWYLTGKDLLKNVKVTSASLLPFTNMEGQSSIERLHS